MELNTGTVQVLVEDLEGCVRQIMRGPFFNDV
jgi:hypothetical protein